MGCAQSNLTCPRPQQEMAERSPFLDLIEIPAIGALFHQYLGSEERKQARLACRALCMLVDTNIRLLGLQLPDTHKEEHYMGLRLKQRRLQPQRLVINGRKSKNSNRGDALAAAGLDFFMQRVQEATIDDTVFPAGIAQVLTLSKRGISTMLAWPDTGDGWQVLGQYTSLEDLAIWRPEQTCNFSASWWQALSSLRSLTALRLGVQLVDFSPLPHLAQLTLLHLSVPKSQPVDHAAALTHLTAVIELGIYAASYPINLSMHSSIACAIGAMSSLQRLDLPEVAPGAWTDALTRLKGLTQLTARYLGCQDAACRLHMPSLKVLYTCQITARQLALITAPSLTHLLRLEPSYTPNIRLLCESGQPDIVKVSASGLLRHCNRVHVRPLDPSGGIWAQAESHATLNALCQSWRPTADVMGSDAASRVWDLEVECMEFGQAEAALVPAGITHLRLSVCTLSPGSLAPLANLSSLRELSISFCLYVKVEEMEHLLSSAVQGKALKICLQMIEGGLARGGTKQDYRDMYVRVVAARGVANTPSLALKPNT